MLSDQGMDEEPYSLLGISEADRSIFFSMSSWQRKLGHKVKLSHNQKLECSNLPILCLTVGQIALVMVQCFVCISDDDKPALERTWLLHLITNKI